MINVLVNDIFLSLCMCICPSIPFLSFSSNFIFVFPFFLSISEVFFSLSFAIPFSCSLCSFLQGLIFWIRKCFSVDQSNHATVYFVNFQQQVLTWVSLYFQEKYIYGFFLFRTSQEHSPSNEFRVHTLKRKFEEQLAYRNAYHSKGVGGKWVGKRLTANRTIAATGNHNREVVSLC